MAEARTGTERTVAGATEGDNESVKCAEGPLLSEGTIG